MQRYYGKSRPPQKETFAATSWRGGGTLRSVAGTLLIKGAIVLGLLALMLPALGRVSPLPVVWLALAVTGGSYVLSDRIVLNRAGNAAAVVCDFVLAVTLLYGLGRVIPGVRLPFGGALTAGGALTVAEILFHQHLLAKGVGIR